VIKDPAASGCTNDILDENCYPGWDNASGTPNTTGVGETIFIWGYPCELNSEAVIGSFNSPLVPGKTYVFEVTYKTATGGAYNGIVDNVYCQLTQNKHFTGTYDPGGGGSQTQTLNNPDPSYQFTDEQLKVRKVTNPSDTLIRRNTGNSKGGNKTDISTNFLGGTGCTDPTVWFHGYHRWRSHRQSMAWAELE
jgi:hypothetical protein